MTEDEKAIRDLIERWARAVHAGDLDTVIAHHAGDIVMFDVPPPHDGVRGLQAYAATWPGFFEWQASGACFEIVSLEITAGVDVAFAHALLRCDSPDGLAARPEQRLRLTLGLHGLLHLGDAGAAAHEHHSVADETPAPDVDERAVPGGAQGRGAPG